MKKHPLSAVCTCTVGVLFACVLQVHPRGTSPHQPSPQCRRLQVTGTITTAPTPKPGFRGVIPAAEGKFTMDLLFPERGGEVIRQQNTIELTRVTSYSFGGAQPCKNTLSSAARAPQAFSVWASLDPGSVIVKKGADEETSAQDAYYLTIKTIPSFPPITYTAQCGAGRPGEVSDYGTSFTQLLRVFTGRTHSGNILLNRASGKYDLPDVDIFGALKGHAEWEMLETLVPCSSFQPTAARSQRGS